MSELEIALNKLPWWKDIARQLKDLPNDAEFNKMCVEFEASLEHDLNFDFDTICQLPTPDRFVVDKTLPATRLPSTMKVSIRIPTATVIAFKERSKVAKVGYQTLINRALKAATKV